MGTTPRFAAIFFCLFFATAYAGEIHPGGNQRFADNGDGTVTDKRTGLMWTKDANPSGARDDWHNALSFVRKMRKGAFGYKDWRMPTVKELDGMTASPSDSTPRLPLSAEKASILEGSSGLMNAAPLLPQGHPFTNAVSYWYWSYTDSDCKFKAWAVNLATGQKWREGDKGLDLFHLWPVRGPAKAKSP